MTRVILQRFVEPGGSVLAFVPMAQEHDTYCIVSRRTHQIVEETWSRVGLWQVNGAEFEVITGYQWATRYRKLAVGERWNVAE